MLDPDTGAGAYKIAGGANGGMIFIAGVGLLAIGALMAIGVASAGLWFGSMILATTIIALGLNIVLIELACNPDLSWGAVKSNVLTILGIFLMPFGFFESKVVAAVAAVIGVILALLGIS